jgi:hypothetical protein
MSVLAHPLVSHEKAEIIRRRHFLRPQPMPIRFDAFKYLCTPQHHNATDPQPRTAGALRPSCPLAVAPGPALSPRRWVGSMGLASLSSLALPVRHIAYNCLPTALDVHAAINTVCLPPLRVFHRASTWAAKARVSFV